MKTAAEIREQFLKYFESRGHTRVASSSLVPQNDPTLLFSNAGMNQFKDTFLGNDPREYSRAASCQKCLRISGKHNDFENVGVTTRHHTFFEMLGNFSFGDYFKKDAIRYGWEFVTEVLKLPKERLWVTIFEDDDEAEQLWREQTDIYPSRILRLGEEENFWAMGDTGPCGPCSEIHYYRGDDVGSQSAEAFINDGESYIEIWNLVFMQFERDASGKMTKLPKPSIDTGMGLERVAGIMSGGVSNYDGDIFRGIISVCEELSGHRYSGKDFSARDLRSDLNYARDVAMRVIADHSRSIAFLIADGVLPASDGRGYVLRRILRRAVRHGRVLEFDGPFLQKTCAAVIDLMGDHYSELKDQRDTILKIAHAEETKFHETLDSGLSILQKEVEKLKSGELFPGETAFLLHDTYGFPLDLTEDALKTYSMRVDVPAYQRALDAQRSRSREDRKSQDITFTSFQIDGQPTEFLGYSQTSAESRFVQIVAADSNSKVLRAGDKLSVFVEASPFYAESGGQVGDTGFMRSKDCLLEVLDTQKYGKGYIQHICSVKEGELSLSSIGLKVELEVDAARRNKIKLNHSATHLLHSGLRKFLGDHVKQAGSRVDQNTLRFDYSHFEAVSEEQLAAIQEFVNEQIRANYEVSTQLMKLEDAKKAGATALFGEKYTDDVRVVTIGPESMELCGGTHVQKSGDIGFLMLSSEGGISAGVRRIECWTGANAFQQLLEERQTLQSIARLVKCDNASALDRVEKSLQRSKELERELELLKSKLASAASGDLADRARMSPAGIRVISEQVESADTPTLREMVDRLRLKLGSGVVALGTTQDDKGVIVAGVTSDLTGKLHAGNLIKELTQFSGGRGGGRPDFAQAGGVDVSKLPSALEKFFELIS